jgi:hypothetical protein
MMLERDIQESIRQAAKDFGWSSLGGGFFYHTWNSQKSEKGFPDIVMSNGSHLIVAEVKRNKPHGKVTPEQRAILDILSEHIPLTFLWREDDLQEAYEVLANPGYYYTWQHRPSLWKNRRKAEYGTSEK